MDLCLSGGEPGASGLVAELALEAVAHTLSPPWLRYQASQLAAWSLGRT